MSQPAALRSSISWLMGDRVIRLLATAPVTLFVARSLGPEVFGRLGLALGISGIAILITQLGLDRILRRDLAEAPGQAGSLMGTAGVLTLAAALLSIGAVSVYAHTSVDDPVTRRLILILAWGALPQVLSPADYWFQSVLHPRVAILVRTVVLVISAALRIAGCLFESPVEVFAWIALGEWTVGGMLVSILMVRRPEAPARMTFSTEVANRWVREAWPAFLMLLFGSAFERVDLLMLQHFAPPSEAGFYTAAQRFSELWWSLSATAATAIVPWLSRVRQTDLVQYRRVLQQYLDVSMAATVAVAIGATVFVPWLLPLILGEQYAPSVWVLVLLCWTGVGVYAEMARSQYLLIERRLHLDVIINVIHMAATAVLCWWAVPKWGAQGAALVRCIGYMSVAWVLPWCFPSLHGVARMQWRAFLFFTRFGELRDLGRRLIDFRRKKSG